MDSEKIKSEIATKRAGIRRLSETLTRHTCDGTKYSLPEDVEVMEKIESLEDEIEALKKRLSAPE